MTDLDLIALAVEEKLGLKGDYNSVCWIFRIGGDLRTPDWYVDHKPFLRLLLYKTHLAISWHDTNGGSFQEFEYDEFETVVDQFINQRSRMGL